MELEPLFAVSSNCTANGGKNKTTSLSSGLRKFTSRCERRMKTEGGKAEEGWWRRMNPVSRLAPQSSLGSLPAEKTIQPVLISS